MAVRWALAGAILAGSAVMAHAESGPPLPPDRILNRIYKAITAHKLTSLRKACYSLVAAEPEKAGEFMVDVREIHNKVCGGDPETDGLRMFSVRVVASGALLSDALSDDRSEYLPLK